MLGSLREEIAFFNLVQLLVVILVTTLAVAVYLAAHHERFSRAALFVPFLIASGLFAVGRADLLMHRAGSYVAALEQKSEGTLGWESVKLHLTQTKVLPIYDALGLSAWIFLLIWSEREAKQILNPRARTAFVIGTLALVALGGLSIVYGSVVR